jgi:hypothetical protein
MSTVRKSPKKSPRKSSQTERRSSIDHNTERQIKRLQKEIKQLKKFRDTQLGINKEQGKKNRVFHLDSEEMLKTLETQENALENYNAISERMDNLFKDMNKLKDITKKNALENYNAISERMDNLFKDMNKLKDITKEKLGVNWSDRNSNYNPEGMNRGSQRRTSQGVPRV